MRKLVRHMDWKTVNEPIGGRFLGARAGQVAVWMLTGVIVCHMQGFAGEAIVNGEGRGEGHFVSISAALAGLNRGDGVADVVRVTSGKVWETNTICLDVTRLSSDALAIESAVPGGGAAVVVFAEGIGEFALELVAFPESSVSIKGLTLVPRFKEHGAGLVRDFACGGVRVLLKPGVPGMAGGIRLEEVTVTASLAGNIPAPVAVRRGMYEAQTRWGTREKEGGRAGFRVETSSVGDAECRVALRRCEVGHTAGHGFSVAAGKGLEVTLEECAARFGGGHGYYAEMCDGRMALRSCAGSWNQEHGFLVQSGGGSLAVEDGQFTCNTGRGLQVGLSGRDTIPGRITILGGSFSENGWTDYKLSAAGKYEYGMLVWGGSESVVDIRGTAARPVLFLENFSRGLRIDNAKARLARIEHAVFAGRHQQSALDLVDLDLGGNPVLRHCAFLANTYQSAYHSQVTISVANTNRAKMSFEDCTFYNVAGPGYQHVAVDGFGNAASENLELLFERCIFAGGPAGHGTDERALYLDGNHCTAILRDCALVTEGPYALNAKYAEANLAGHGNQVIEENCIHSDPNFVPSRTTLRDPAYYAAGGNFLRPQSSAYARSRTPGRVDIGGFNMSPGAHAPPLAPVRVAIYTDQGPDLIDVFQTERVLQGCTDVTFEKVKARDIWDGGLEKFDVIMFPGGSAAAEAGSLKPKGRDLVRRHVYGGGGYIGTCAGAYLIMPEGATPRLSLMNSRNVDGDHWARGHGIVRLGITPEGRQVLGTTETETEIEFWQGPLIAPPEGATAPEYMPLAAFLTEIHENGAPAGVMPGTTAIAAGHHGAGRYVAFSAHPEGVITPLFKGDFIYHAIQWARGKGAGEKVKP